MSVRKLNNKVFKRGVKAGARDMKKQIMKKLKSCGHSRLAKEIEKEAVYVSG